MSADLYVNLAWLPRPPEDFGRHCEALGAESAEPGAKLRALATHALDANQLNRLAKAVVRARAKGASLAPLTPFKLGIVSNALTTFIAPALTATAARHGIALDCVAAEFDQVAQTALDPRSAINRAGCDAVLVAIDYRGLPPGDAVAALRHIAAIRDGLRAAGKTLCLVQTVARPPEQEFGSFDLRLAATARRAVDDVNRGLADAIAGTPDILVDVAGLAETVGLAAWHDPAQWHLAKAPFAHEMIPVYADHVCRLIAALRGKSRRCLVLDLDNTLWGGVIGDDGLDGIRLGQGDATGEAYLAFQRHILALRARGIVLAVCSKNNEAIAREAFRKHPEMALKEEHIAAFRIDWNDKPGNLRAIAQELALGLDSLVFVDDNPFERNLVRQTLPQIAVPELPEDPALYARTLAAAGYFEAIAFSAEDAKRADAYRDNARRAEMRGQSVDLDSYLDSLKMVITFQPFDEMGRARIAQLINKSNQFNLTTKRYTEAEVRAAERDPDCFTLQVRLADTFGDNGMISVVICRRAGEDWSIDTWLMSCRVLGRKVEAAILQELLREARRRGIRRILGRYLPTERNALVKDHYRDLGFARIGAAPDGSTDWELKVAEAPSQAVPMEIRRPAEAA